jgi:tetratricopeptide (TPR) repeat protein
MVDDNDIDEETAALLETAFDEGLEDEDEADDAFVKEARLRLRRQTLDEPWTKASRPALDEPARHRLGRQSLDGGSAPWMYSGSADFGELERQLFNAIVAVRNDDHTTFDLDVSLKLLEKIRTQAITHRVDSVIAAIEVETAKVLRHTGHLKEAAARGSLAIEISEREGWRRTCILAHFELGMLFSGNDESATDRHYSAAEAMVREGDVDLRARLTYGRARAARKRADLRGAIGLIERSISLYERSDDPFGLARARARLGSYLRLRGDFPRATDQLDLALTMARRSGFKRVEALALLDLGHIYRLARRDDSAHAVLTSAKVLFSEIGHSAGRAHALIGLAVLEQRGGDHERAVASAKEALILYRERDIRACRATSAPTAFALRTLGECWRDAGKDPRMAEQYLNGAIDAYRLLDNRDGVALSLAAKATLLARSPEKIRDALTFAMEAVDGLADMPGRFWQGVDNTALRGNHSWCFDAAVSIALTCDAEPEQWKAINTAASDKRLRELRLSLGATEGPLGDAVRELCLVELMMRPPAHDPDLGFVPAERGGLVARREELLDRVHDLSPSAATDLRAPALAVGVAGALRPMPLR